MTATAPPKVSKFNSYETVTKEHAEERGFGEITSPYGASEVEMLDNVIHDMQGVNYLLVRTVDGIQVYRKNKDLCFNGGTRNVWS